MLRRLLIIFLSILVVTASGIIFHLPYRLLPILLRVRFGIKAEMGEITGGFRDGHRYRIYINNPKIKIASLGASGNSFLRIPSWLNTDIFINDAELVLEEGSPVRFNGSVNVFRNNITIDKMRFLFGEIGLALEGSIDKDRNLDINANFIDSENKFSIKGPLDKPQINTHWSGLDTSFQIEDIRYEAGQLAIPKITGNVKIKGFPPLDLSGGMCIERDHIRFNDMTILEAARLDGIVNKNKPSRIRLFVDNVPGARMAGKMPAVLQALLQPHKINADIKIYGMMNNLQAGGNIKLLSTPVEIVCRYRNNKFLFHSTGNGAFDIAGSINWGQIPDMRINVVFNQIDIKEFIGLLGRQADPKWKGIIDGRFSITGELDAPLIESRLEITEAEFGGMKFDSAYLNLTGTGAGPLNLAHSMVYYKDISAELTGFIDPRENDIFNNIEIRPVGDAIIWEGVNILKDAEGGRVTIGKDLGKNISIRVKSAITSDSAESSKEKPEVELEYKLREDKNLLLRMQEDEGTIGVEHKVKF